MKQPLVRLGVEIEANIFHDLKVAVTKKKLTLRQWVRQSALKTISQSKP